MPKDIDYSGYQDAWKKADAKKVSPAINKGNGQPAEVKIGDAIIPGSMSEQDATVADAILRAERTQAPEPG